MTAVAIPPAAGFVYEWKVVNERNGWGFPGFVATEAAAVAKLDKFYHRWKRPLSLFRLIDGEWVLYEERP